MTARTKTPPARKKRPAAETPWRSRILRHADIDPQALQANPANWRLHTARQGKGLSAVLQNIGWVQTVIVNERTGHLVDGHLRVELAVARKEPTVPVAYVDLSPEEEAIILATLDPLAAMAETDTDRLAVLLKTAEGATADAILHGLLNTVGAQYDLAIADGSPTAADQQEAPAPPRRTSTKPGTLFRLGRHRLLVADACLPASYTTLCGKELVDCVWTDPPYGVDYEAKNDWLQRSDGRSPRAAGASQVTNDTLTEESLLALLRTAFRAALIACRKGAVWYVAAPPGVKGFPFETVLRELGLLRHQLIWVKESFVLGRPDYHYRHEQLFYGWTGGGAHYFIDDRTQDSVWEIPRPRASKDHPTMKPIALVARALVNSTRPGEIVLDPFAGSGTTLLAAEHEGRTARVLELDPRYADVIVERWQAMTGQKAKILTKGR